MYDAGTLTASIGVAKLTPDQLRIRELERELAAHGIQMDVNRIKRLRKAAGIRCNHKRNLELPQTLNISCQLRLTCWVASLTS